MNVERGRIVAAPVDDIRAALTEWLRHELFEPVRDHDGVVVFDPRPNPGAERYRPRRLAHARRVVVAVEATDAGVAVLLTAEVAGWRRRRAEAVGLALDGALDRL